MTADAALDRGRDQPVAGVGHRRHPGVGHQHHPLAGLERLDQQRRAAGLVALEVGHHPAGERDPELGGQPPEPAGVLGGDHVGAGQLVGQPRRGVGDPADRGGREHQHAAPAHVDGPRADDHPQPYRLSRTCDGTYSDRVSTAPRRTLGLSRTADGRTVPSRAGAASPRPRLRRRWFAGWAATAAVTLLALFLRLWDLGRPHAFLFDETYYAKDAWSLWHHGYVTGYVDNANEKILAGQPARACGPSTPSMVVHPEVGKWLIGLGEALFGMDPFGWRVASAVVGTLMVLVMVRLARRLTGSTLLGVVAGLLLCFDGLQLVLSRLALLDIFHGVLRALRRRPAWSPTGTGAALRLARLASRLASAPTSTGARCAGCCGVPGGCSPECCSASASARSGAPSSRSRRSACWCGPGTPARGARSACAARVLRRLVADALPAFG